MGNIVIRDSVPVDLSAVTTLYSKAFPNEDLMPLVTALMAEPTQPLSLVAVEGPSIVGHVMFTICGVIGTETRIALLAPLAVASSKQQQGIGSTLVRSGCQRLQELAVAPGCVLGDPAYYEQFGFAANDHLLPPYTLPKEWRPAWQSVNLGNAKETCEGQLSVPKPWRDPALWGAEAR
ncbi:MAG: GNAT family N-acetyltransferase [Magnetovibrio sp.]|nr:GNAT family N-acetyltransferase [Magnetovibrio sp.]